MITAHIALQVLWTYGRAKAGFGYPPSGFHERLLSAITKADTTNRALLALGFPGYVDACDLIERHEDGVDRLIAIVRKADTT